MRIRRTVFPEFAHAAINGYQSKYADLTFLSFIISLGIRLLVLSFSIEKFKKSWGFTPSSITELRIKRTPATKNQQERDLLKLPECV